MKLEDIIYDVKTILDALQITTRVKDRYLIHKINNYRALFLEQMFEEQNGKDVNPLYYSRWPNQLGTVVDSADFETNSISTIKFMKYSLPKVIKLDDVNKSIKVRSVSRQIQFYYKTLPEIMELIFSDSFLPKLYHYWYIEGNEVYIYQPVKADFLLLLEDPTDGYEINTHIYDITNLENGNTYVVISGIIRQDTGVAMSLYKVEDEFTCNTDYTYEGDGKVKLSIQMEQLTKSGDYPIERSMAQKIVLAILTNEYKIEQGTITDITNDAMDQFRVIKSQDD